MSFERFAGRDSFVRRLDPRVRIAVCVLAIAACGVAHSMHALLALFIASFAALCAACISAREIGWRLLGLNLFAASLSAMKMPEGVEVFAPYACRIGLRCNAMLLFATALAGTMDMSSFGHALAHLGVPSKLAHLLLMTVRQMETLRLEYLRLKDAMKARAFRPGLNIHTYRSLGTLAAMLLVRSLDRAERVSDGMKCRLFSGDFFLMDHFKMHGRDWIFGTLSCTFLLAAVALERTWIH